MTAITGGTEVPTVNKTQKSCAAAGHFPKGVTMRSSEAYRRVTTRSRLENNTKGEKVLILEQTQATNYLIATRADEVLRLIPSYSTSGGSARKGDSK